MSNHYSTLGVSPSASKDEIKKAYRAKARAAHPDTGGSDEAFHALQRAFKTLSDDEARLHYDATGSDDRPDDEAMANTIIREILLKLLDAAEEKVYYLDINKIIRDNVNEGIAKARLDLASAEAKLLRLRRVLKRVRTKQPDSIDVMSFVLQTQIRQQELELHSRGTHIKGLEKALELADTFVYEPEQLPEQEQHPRTATEVRTRQEEAMQRIRNAGRGWWG